MDLLIRSILNNNTNNITTTTTTTTTTNNNNNNSIIAIIIYLTHWPSGQRVSRFDSRHLHILKVNYVWIGVHQVS